MKHQQRHTVFISGSDFGEHAEQSAAFEAAHQFRMMGFKSVVDKPVKVRKP